MDISGMVNTLKSVLSALEKLGHQVQLITPAICHTFSCPSYPEVKLANKPYKQVAESLERFEPHAIHIATEGPMGLAARKYCIKNNLQFTTGYHTHIPQYLSSRYLLPKSISYLWLRWFHAPSRAVLVPAQRIKNILGQRGFKNLVLCERAVDTAHFKARERDLSCIQRPLYLYVGRLATEKNIDAFLQITMPGTKWVIGDGPLREQLQQRYPEVVFLGTKLYDELPAYYNCADVMVFPSRTDTVGAVLLEAMACGVPIAAFPVDGVRDVVIEGRTGIMHENLGHAISGALRLSRIDIRRQALHYSSSRSAKKFLRNLHPVRNLKKGKDIRQGDSSTFEAELRTFDSQMKR